MIKTISTVDKKGETHLFAYEYEELGRITKRDYNDDLYEKYRYESDSLILIEQYAANYNITGLLL